MLDNQMAQNPHPTQAPKPVVSEDDPFGGANLFKDLQKATSGIKEKVKAEQPPSQGNDKEDNLLNMYENLAKQLEKLEDGEYGEEDEASIEEAEKTMKNMFGFLMGGGQDQGTDQMMSNLFKAMGMGGPAPK